MQMKSEAIAKSGEQHEEPVLCEQRGMIEAMLVDDLVVRIRPLVDVAKRDAKHENRAYEELAEHILALLPHVAIGLLGDCKQLGRHGGEVLLHRRAVLVRV